MTGNPKDIAAQAEDRAPLDLLEGIADEQTARVLGGGAIKYGRQNYRVVDVRARVYAAAMRRHIREWLDGSDEDHESGQHPLAHVAANVHVVLGAMEQGTLIDDRGPGDPVEGPAE